MASSNSRKASSSGRSQSRKSSSTKRGTNKRKTKQQESFRNEVILWVVFAISIILFIANFGLGGTVGNAVSTFFFGVFGLVSYVFPICLFVGVAFFLSNRGSSIAWVKLTAAILFVLFVCLFAQLVCGAEHSISAVEAFNLSEKTKIGGGVIGGALQQLLYPAVGLFGTFVIDFIIIIISLVLLTEKSAIRGIKRGGRAIYDSAKDESVRRREVRELRREERELRREEELEQRRQELQERRMDMHVSGVSMDTKLIAPEENNADSDEVSELRVTEQSDIPEVTEHSKVKLDSKGNVFESFHKLFEEPQTESPQPIEPIPAKASSQVPVETPAFSSDFQIQGMYTDDIGAEDISDAVLEDDFSETEQVAANHKNPKQSKEDIAEDVAATVEEAQALQNQTEQLKEYHFPPVELLKSGDGKTGGDSKQYLQETAQKLQQTLKTFGVNVTITNVSCGPSVTRFELQPEMGVKVSKIVNLADDIKLNLAAADIRIEAPIPGKAAVGIEVPNKESTPVMFRDLVESKEFQEHSSPIAFAAGKDIGGQVLVTDIAKMPHLLIAGATGSGKSVCINTIIMSILYRAHPDDVKLIMIDPKVVELSVYNGIPHLFIPVVTDPKKAAGALHWAVAEMTERYNKFAEYGVRDLKGYNQKVDAITAVDDPDMPKKMPQIVIIVDELADLMMVAPGDVEDAICRLAQLARAAGIHLIIATQRPSVNVITGLIKANMPSRIAFSVTSGVDSRTILDMNGAEKLLGKGDMLFYPQGLQKPLRAQGAFVSDKEVADVVAFLKEQMGDVSYSSEIEDKMNRMSQTSSGASSEGTGAPGDDKDAYFVDAAKLLIEKDKGSIGMLQRYFKVGFNRAARIMDQLEEAGVVGPEEGTKPRQVLMSPEQLEVYIDENL